MKIAICDDDVQLCNSLRQILKEEDDAHQVDCFSDGKELLACPLPFDLIFLDIDMPGKNGMETAQELRSRDKAVKIIYVTAFTDYAHFALSVHAFAYLLKPVKRQEILQQLKEIRLYQNAAQAKKTKLRFESADGWIEEELSDIYYFEYQNRKTYLMTKNERIALKSGITVLASKMEVHGFAMPHKSFAVNLHYVKSIKGYEIYMMNGERIPLSQKKSPDFREKLLQYQAAHFLREGDCLWTVR